MITLATDLQSPTVIHTNIFLCNNVSKRRTHTSSKPHLSLMDRTLCNEKPRSGDGLDPEPRLPRFPELGGFVQDVPDRTGVGGVESLSVEEPVDGECATVRSVPGG